MTFAEGAGLNTDVGASTSNYAPYAAAAQASTDVLSGFLETGAFKDKLSANYEAAVINAGNKVTAFELSSSQNAEQIKNLNEVLGDKLTDRTLRMVKERALSKAASAEGGLSGGTIGGLIDEAELTAIMDKASIISEYRHQRMSVTRAMERGRASTEFEIDNILLGGAMQINTNIGIAGLHAGMQGSMSVVQLLPDSEKAKLFNT